MLVFCLRTKRKHMLATCWWRWALIHWLNWKLCEVLVNIAERHLSLKGQIKLIYFTQLYKLTANWLLKRYITTVGTLNSTRIWLPDELKNPKELEEFSRSVILKLIINSYTVKSKSKGMKNVLLSTAWLMKKKIEMTRKKSQLFSNFMILQKMVWI